MKIEIEKDEKGAYHVWQHGKTTGAMCAGEMLEQIVTLLEVRNPFGGYAMLTPAEWEARNKAAYDGEAKC